MLSSKVSPVTVFGQTTQVSDTFAFNVRFRSRLDKFDVVYVGMTRAGDGGGVRARLRRHKKKKSGMWSHCSVFEVWENIRDEEIEELEGLFRHIYLHDSKANKLNIQREHKNIAEVRDDDIENW